MEISGVKVELIQPKETPSRVKGIAQVLLDNCLVIKDIKIVEMNPEKIFIAMPSRKLPTGDFADIVFPTTPEFRAQLEDAILKKYYEVLNSAQ